MYQWLKKAYDAVELLKLIRTPAQRCECGSPECNLVVCETVDEELARQREALGGLQ